MRGTTKNSRASVNDTPSNLILNEENDMTDWWVGTVLLTFFPILVSTIISIFAEGVDLDRMIGDGELVLSSFLIITPSIMNYYKTSAAYGGRHKLFFYLLLFIAFFQLTAYTSIKTNSSINVCTVYFTSVLCVLSSIIISWHSEKYLKRGSDQ